LFTAITLREARLTVFEKHDVAAGADLIDASARLTPRNRIGSSAVTTDRRQLMKHVVIGLSLVVSMWVPGARAQTEKASPKPPMIYVEPTADGFETYIVAAIIKKKVPASVVQKSEMATLTLKPAKVEEHKDATSTKVVKCIFGTCGNTDQANTSVQLVDGNGVIVWSYSVNKSRGEKNRQSMAEAIASHLKSEYFHQ